MKVFGALALFLASSSAFVPQQGSTSRSTALASASVDESTSRMPNPAIKAMAKGMGLLKPVFAAEAQLQAAALGKLAGVDEEQVMQDIESAVKSNKVVIYTYGLSPFSTEAVSMLEASGYPFTQIELGPEWFLLGGEESVKRVALSKLTETGATSLPKIFIGGECIGGCSELANLVENGELDVLMKKAKVSNGANTKKAGLFGLF